MMAKTQQYGPKFGIFLLISILWGLHGCSPLPEKSVNNQLNSDILPPPDPTLIVDCTLPARIKRLGPSSSYMGSRRALKTSSQDCEIRGGEYVAYDRANFNSALAVWLPLAKKGNASAQHYVATIYTKKMGVKVDFSQAAHWYMQAAEQDFSPAQYSLAYLYEHGLGVQKNPGMARYWYQRAAGFNVDDSNLEMHNESSIPSEINIQLIEPNLPSTRSLSNPPIILSQSASNQEKISGIIRSSRPLSLFSINDLSLNTDVDGLFNTNIIIPPTGTLVDIVAVDDLGFRTSQQLVFSYQRLKANPVKKESIKYSTSQATSNNYALVIANNNYKHLPKLKTPKNDARSLKRLLQQKYGFKQVRALYNTNRYQVITALNALRYELTEEDNLLIYYAGHGELDKINKRSQWLPIDAEPNNTANWISDSSLSELINAMQAKRVMVIADSCYAGMMTRSVFDNVIGNSKLIDLNKKSRTVLTSGGVSPVLDIGGGEHSLFAAAMLTSLKNNNTILSGQQLYRQVTASVSIAAADMSVDQVPEYAPIEFANHEAGDFIFIPQ